jgi:hypothetical protein
MASIVLRSTNGGPLTNSQIDSNISNLNNDILTRAILNQAPLSQANILPNSSAEMGNYLWTGTSTTHVDATGTYWQVPSTASTTSVTQSSDSIVLGAGTTLYLQAEITNTGMSAGSVFLNVSFYNSSNTLLSTSTSLTVANGSGTTWVYGSVLSPTNTTYCMVNFGYTNAITTNTTIRRIKLSQSLSIYSQEATIYVQQKGNPNQTFTVADAASTNQASSLGQLNTATAPSALLASIKTVDGSGSGLDADLLDGRDSTSFANVAGSSTHWYHQYICYHSNHCTFSISCWYVI